MNGDSVVGAAAALLGMVYSLQALRLPKALIGNPWAPMYFPLGIGAVMTILGAVLCLSSLRSARKHKTAETRKASESQAKPAVDKEFPRLALGTIGLCVLYAATFMRLGFVVSTLLFLGAMLFLVNGIRRRLTNIIVTAAFTYGIWFAFERLLMIHLP